MRVRRQARLWNLPTVTIAIGLVIGAVAAPVTAAAEGVHLTAAVQRSSGPSLLAREIARQALLMSVREGLGAAARDEVLGETPGGLSSFTPRVDMREKSAKRFNPQGKIIEGPTSLVMTVRVLGAGDEELGRLEFDTSGRRADLATVADLAAEAAFGPMLELWRDAGINGEKAGAKADGDVPDEIRQVAADFSLVAQFDVVRRLHKLMETEGSSPERLATLAEAYARLGLLSGYAWRPIAEPYIARSLIYAERAVDLAPDNPRALEARGYTRCLAGLHASALEDAKAVRNPSAQTQVVQAASSTRLRDLAQLAQDEEEVRALALTLMTLAVASTDNEQLLQGYGDVALQVRPDHFALIALLADEGGVQANHRYTPMLLGVLGQQLAAVAQLEGVPADFARHSSQGQLRDAMKVLDSVEDTADGAPTMAALAMLMREAAFVAAFRRIYFEGRQLSVDVSDSVADLRELYTDHPFEVVIEVLALGKAPGRVPELEQKLAVLVESDMTPRAFDIEQVLYTLGPEVTTRRVVSAIGRGLDPTVYDVEWMLRTLHRVNFHFLTPQYTKTLKEVAPHSIVRVVALLEQEGPGLNDPVELTDEQVAHWEAQYAGNPVVEKALAGWYQRHGNEAKARALLEESTAVVGDFESIQKLASTKLAAGDIDGYVQTMEQVLEHPDPGLRHARARSRIADALLAADRAEEALPYAEAAAASGAEWALDSLREVYQVLERWEEAEKIVIRTSRRYGTPVSWLGWTVATGHGDRKAAEAQTRAFIENQTRRASTGREVLLDVAIFHLLVGEPDAAMETYARSLQHHPGDVYTGLMLALLRNGSGDTQGRDAALKAGLEGAERFVKTGSVRRQLITLARTQQAAWAGTGEPVTFEQVNGLERQTSPSEAANIWYFYGVLQQQSGNVDAAREAYVRAVILGGTRQTTEILSLIALRDLGEDGAEVP